VVGSREVAKSAPRRPAHHSHIMFNAGIKLLVSVVRPWHDAPTWAKGPLREKKGGWTIVVCRIDEAFGSELAVVNEVG
jgi:hypothetical protein